MELSREKVKELLPHRDPMLLIDHAAVNAGSEARAEVYLDPAWEIFRGHFPGHAVCPGIYILEAMAQTADLIVMTLPEYEGRLPLLSGVARMRFLRPVYPGDTLCMRAELSANAGGGIFECSVSATVNGQRAASGVLTLALREDTQRF